MSKLFPAAGLIHAKQQMRTIDLRQREMRRLVPWRIRLRHTERAVQLVPGSTRRAAFEQATMSLDALSAALGRSERTEALYNYLEHPSTYRPADFAALFRKAAGE